MVKKIIAGVLVLAIIILAGFKLFYKGDSLEKKLSSVGENLTSYHTEATMDVNENEDTRSFFVTVDYKNEGEKDLFRISLLDKNINQEQIMLRNKDGVYVLTPKLNQVYEFKGDYPLNSPKPYLYHSMIKEIKNGDFQAEKLNDGYLITITPKYENSPHWVKEDIKLSTDLKPVWVNIYDENNATVVAINFTKVDFNTTYENSYYDVETNMNNSRKDVVSSTDLAKKEDLPLLPSSLSISSTLKEQTEATVNGDTVFILSYDGAKEFTIVQSLVKENSKMEVASVSGNLVELTSGLGYLNGNKLTFIYNGVEYNIYSSSLSINEMVEIANSMNVVVAK